MNRFLSLCCLSIWALCLFLARVNFVEAEAAKSVDGGDNDEISDFLIEENPDYFSDNDSGSDSESDSDGDGDNYDEDDDENDEYENEDAKSKISKALNKTKKTTNKAIKVLKKNRTTVTLSLIHI